MKKIISVSFIYIFIALTTTAVSDEIISRNRGESFYTCESSNTTGRGNIWLVFDIVGHVWDDKFSKGDSAAQNLKWASNIRAFPQLRVDIGLLDYCSFFFESRVLSWGFKPGWIGSGVKLTYPANSVLRLHGLGLTLKYSYQFLENDPTIGGYTGFMPERFVVKGSSLETKLIYELDFLSVISTLPLRFIVNYGIRLPLVSGRSNLCQFLYDFGLVFNGYFFDLFILYSIEAFNNIAEPAEIDVDGKKILVYFSENPMYLTLGGTIRYKNGMALSLSIPILLSKNSQSSLSLSDKIELHRNENPDRFKEEKARGIKDPFDPWYVNWKIAASFIIPIKYKSTSTETMRTYLINKAYKDDKKIDIDKSIQKDQPDNKNDEIQDRLKKINERRNEILNQE